LTETLGQLADGGTLDFIIGCLPQNGWMQTTTGNVYAATSLRSSIPAIATYFSLANGTHSPGIVTYGTTDAYDFSLDPGPKGEDQVSVPGWLTNQPYTPVNWYERYAHQLDAANKTTIAEPRTEVAQPACTEDPCIFYADGNMTTGTTQWSVGAVGSPKNMILVVKGNLTINAPIRIAAGSFFAAIVRGDITVNSTVNALDGIYMASNENHNAAFSSGASASQLVVNGSVLADTFTMERDLGAANSTTPGESVVFNPQLLFTMPDVMKETPYIWQEVAP